MAIELISFPGEMIPFYSAANPVSELKLVKQYLDDKGWSLGGSVVQSFIDLSVQIGLTDISRTFILSPDGKLSLVNIGFPSKHTFCTMTIPEKTIPSEKVDVESYHRKLPISVRLAIERTPWNQCRESIVKTLRERGATVKALHICTPMLMTNSTKISLTAEASGKTLAISLASGYEVD